MFINNVIHGDGIEDELVTKKKLKSGDPQVTRKAILEVEVCFETDLDDNDNFSI